MNRYRAAVAVAAGALAVGYFWRTRQRNKISPSPPSPQPDVIVEVYFGSQTGTSESFARDLVEEGRSEQGFPESVICDAKSVESWTEFPSDEKKIVILILSTYGEGDPSDDAVIFNDFLSNFEGSIENITFAIFGCGNRQYAFFNEMAKRTEKNMVRLGAQKICETGLGDDNADIESDFREWKDKHLWPLLKQIVKESGIVLQDASKRNPRDRIQLDIQIADKRSKLKFDACVSSSGGDVLSKFFFAANQVPVVSVTNLCDSKTLVDLDISKVPCLRYRSGDTLELLPRNRSSSVDWLCYLYGVEPSHMLTFLKKKSCRLLSVKKPFPTPVNVRFALASYIDLHGIPSRSFIRDLCLVMGQNPEGPTARRDEAINAGKVYTVEQVLRDLKVGPKTIDLGDLIQLLPKQKSRGYSICSSPLEDPKKLSLVISRVDDHATASTFLSDTVKPGDMLSVGLRQGTFRLPALPGTPAIMIAAGTGVAPFRAFLFELGFKNRCKTAHLFFGCRKESEWIFRAEMEQFQEKGGHLTVAFSREGNKCYVQDLLRENSEKMKDLILKKGAVVYVCGSTKMGLAIMETIEQTIATVSELRNQKRYFEELWG